MNDPQCMDPPCVARENDKPGEYGLASMYQASCWSSCSGPSWKSARHPILLPAMPRRAIGVISSRMRWKDHFSISSISLADLGGQRSWRLHRVSPDCEHFVLIHAAWDAGFIGLISKLRPPCRTP